MTELNESYNCFVRAMAEAGAEQGVDGPGSVGTLSGLKERLWSVVGGMVAGEDGCSVEEIDEAIEVLCVLAGLVEEEKKKKKKKKSRVVLPEEFVCPISKMPMTEPVVLESGQTYDRLHINRLFCEGQRRCPKTEQALLDTTFVIPNHLVCRLFAGWRKDQGIEISRPVDVNVSVAATTTTFGVTQLESLFKKMDASSGDRKEAVKQLRMLTECGCPSVWAFFEGSPAAVRRLLRLFPMPASIISEPGLQEDVVAVLFSMIVRSNFKNLVEESPSVISVLVESLCSGTATTKNNAAAALSELSTLTSMKLMIAEADALKPLVILLGEGNLPAISNSVSAIYNLCTIVENRRKAIHAGAIKWIVRRTRDRVLVDDFLGLLALLSCDSDAIDQMKELEAVPLLLGVLRETSSERNKEHCVVVLHMMCFSDRTMRREIRRDEKVYGTLWEVAKSGNARARRKANGILDRIWTDNGILDGIWTDISTPDTRSA